jgi:hypothetical protein
VNRASGQISRRVDGIALRAADALHLAQASLAGAAAIVTYDPKMAQAAIKIGFIPLPQLIRAAFPESTSLTSRKETWTRPVVIALCPERIDGKQMFHEEIPAPMHGDSNSTSQKQPRMTRMIRAVRG